MKKISRIINYLFLSVIGLAATATIGLLLYYQSLYTVTPPPPGVNVVQYLTPTTSLIDKPIFLPVPKEIIWANSHFSLENSLHFSSPKEDAGAISKMLANRLHRKVLYASSGNMLFVKNEKLPEQGYRLSIQPNNIRIEYSDKAGLFYSLTTLKQLASQSHLLLPCLQIEDQPDLKIRGAMLDISRGKVPTLETLYSMVDFLADLKYNQLQLYIEGFSFGYLSFKNLWEKTETPLLPAEIRQLDAYCKERFIELVPNQNSLGHMQAWLATDQFKDLAECPEGYKLLGLIEMKSTISPTNPKSLALVKQMSRDLLPNFTSNKFNVNLDEPFELGKCKERKIDNPLEVANLYLDYAKQLDAFIKSEGKEMMMWGDLVSRSPKIIPEIPKDITLLEWGYESFHPFNKICPEYQKAKLHYLVCPGTSSWSSFTGRTDNMMANVENGIDNGIQFGADGMLMTDWGDTPHLQYLTVSYAGFAYAAALSWNYKSKNQVSLGNYLCKLAFKDSSNQMGKVVMDLGRYNQFEEFPMISGTTTSMGYRFGIIDKTIVNAVNKKIGKGISELLPYDDDLKARLANNFAHPTVYNTKAILDFVDNLEGQLKRVHLNLPDSAVVIAEYQNSIRMIRLGAKLKEYNNYHLERKNEENKILLTEMKTLCKTIMQEHEKLWMMRNKRSGLDESLQSFSKLEKQIDEQLILLKSSVITQWMKRIFEKITSVAAVLYLK